MIAKGSTWESWAQRDTLVDFGLVTQAAIVEVRDTQSQITALLITTIRKLESEIAMEEKSNAVPVPDDMTTPVV